MIRTAIPMLSTPESAVVSMVMAIGTPHTAAMVIGTMSLNGMSRHDFEIIQMPIPSPAVPETTMTVCGSWAISIIGVAIMPIPKPVALNTRDPNRSAMTGIAISSHPKVRSIRAERP